jgi:hypothetical protein
MKTSWKAGLNKDEAAEIEQDFISSAHLRKRLSDILNDKINAKRTETLSKDLYQNPSWAYLQADAVGYERALNEVISLLS